MNEIVRKFFDERAEKWNSLEPKTKEELYAFLKEHLPLKRGMKTLDVGCGTGVISEQLYELTGERVTAIDLSPTMIEVAKRTHGEEKIDFLCADFAEMTGNFDFVVCFNAYPHFDADAFAEKANELVNEGGYLAILHNMSRKRLDMHHEAVASRVSRRLSPAAEEAKRFSAFTAEKTVDNDEMFLILLKKHG